jgi:hypothetical protein
VANTETKAMPASACTHQFLISAELRFDRSQLRRAAPTATLFCQ